MIVSQSSPRDVVITGVGPVSPVGVGLHDFWQGVCDGRNGVEPLHELPDGFPVDRFRSRLVARVSDTELRDVEALPCRQVALGRLAGDLALGDAGLTDLCGGAVILGNAIGGSSALERVYRKAMNGSLPDGDIQTALTMWKQLSFHNLAAELAKRYGATHITLTICTGCTSGSDAVGTAYELISSGAVDLALAGSSEAPISPIVYAAFDLIGALSQHNDEPWLASRPFDAGRDGFVIGEGAAMLVLESRQHADARNARIYCRISGYASNSNAYHMTKLPADGASLAKCIGLALLDARLDADEIDHVNAHGSSTPQNDICETNAIKGALGTRANEITVNSLKSMLGHALGAANALELAACALSLRHQFVFPTINLRRPGPGCDLDYVPERGRPRRLRHLVKTANGFSGIHSTIVLSDER